MVPCIIFFIDIYVGLVLLLFFLLLLLVCLEIQSTKICALCSLFNVRTWRRASHTRQHIYIYANSFKCEIRVGRGREIVHEVANGVQPDANSQNVRRGKNRVVESPPVVNSAQSESEMFAKFNCECE